MRGRSFNNLLSGRRLGTLLRWQKAHRCPCANREGSADQNCGVCNGSGRYYDPWSDEFRAGFIGQDALGVVQMLKQMGAAEVGDAVLVVPLNAPCFNDIGQSDRIQTVNSTDTVEWILNPGSPVRLPELAEPVEAVVRTPDGNSVVTVPFPAPRADGRLAVSVPTLIRFRAARLYEVAPANLPKVRSFGEEPQPKRVALARVDWTVR